MEEDNEYLYGKSNPDWKYENKFKAGYTTNPVRRLYDNHEDHSHLSTYDAVYELHETDEYKLGKIDKDKILFYDEDRIKILENIYDCVLNNLRQLKCHRINNGGGEEFIKESGKDLFNKAILEDYPKLGLQINKLSDEKLHKINNDQIKTHKKTQDEQYKNNLNELCKILKDKRKKDWNGGFAPLGNKCRQRVKDEIKWFKRQYQTEIIDLGTRKLNELGKFYLELATGGGKTFIVFSILKACKPDMLICISPRLKINKQNISDKYLSIIDEEYEIFNLSEDKDIDTFLKKDCKKLIVGCFKSYKKIYDIINLNDGQNINIWFDEAHNSIEKWTEQTNDDIKQYLLKSDKISKRIFTSASPDKDIVNKYNNIFGELYNPIKVKELIDLKYLCPVKPMTFFQDKENINTLLYSLHNFVDLERNWGLSFHNECKNAIELFEKHIELYNNDKTPIKPFLIISDKYKTELLKYKYDDIEEFQNTKNSIAYVVKQCDMGYDYEGIDYIIFSDRKMSYKDILQCIGRGLRPDKLGNNGTNKNKFLALLLPIYIEDESKNKFKKVIEVLRYLILDLEIDIDDIIEPTYSNSSSKIKLTSNNYDGEESIKAELIDLLMSKDIINPMNTTRFNKFCINHKIKSQEDYNRFKELNPYLKLKDNIYRYKGFKWKPIIDPDGELYYSTIEECEQKKEELFEKLEKEKDEEEREEIYDKERDDGYKYFHTLDTKIPPYIKLEYFY